MRFELPDTSIEHYLSVCTDTEREIRERHGDFVAAIDRIFDLLAKRLLVGDVDWSPTKALLALNSLMLFASSVRTTLSGHGSAAFPQFRTSIESALYAVLVDNEPKTAKAWEERNKSKSAQDRCRKAFASPARRAGAYVDQKAFVGFDATSWLVEVYEASIDFGGHPNSTSVLRNVRVDENRSDEMVGVKLTGVHGAGAPQTVVLLIACLDVGMAVSVLLATLFDSVEDEIVNDLSDLNELKEKLSKEAFA